MKLNLSKTSCALAMIFSGILVSAPVLAEKPSWAGGGGKGQSQARNDDVRDNRFERDNRVVLDRDNRVVLEREEVRRLHNDRVVTYDCPPGLAKKNNGCMPPGQAKKMPWTVGQPIPAGVVVSPVPQSILTQLAPVPAGHRYVRVGDDILLLSPGTASVIDVIRHLGRG